ncbi:MAG: PA-phosphatase [Sphingobacteriales bacterium]|nr:PA-phosphatase [Sphingobacteriales bacterium]
MTTEMHIMTTEITMLLRRVGRQNIRIGLFDQINSTPLLRTHWQLPLFPGYPSGHATTSNAIATMLAYLFPTDADEFFKRAQDCADSRFEGGIHFRTDNEVGLTMGKLIGQEIIKKAKADGAN